MLRIPHKTGVYTFVAQFGSIGIGSSILFNLVDAAVDPSDNIYVVDTGNNCIEKFNSNGNYQMIWGSGGSSNGQFSSPKGITVDSSGNVYVTDTGNKRVQKFTGHTYPIQSPTQWAYPKTQNYVSKFSNWNNHSLLW